MQSSTHDVPRGWRLDEQHSYFIAAIPGAIMMDKEVIYLSGLREVEENVNKIGLMDQVRYDLVRWYDEEHRMDLQRRWARWVWSMTITMR
jgi:hypothetical protein